MTYEEYNKAIDILAKQLINEPINSIYPVPRGGYYPAIRLSKILEIPIVTEITSSSTLIVDDICDSGKTMSRYESNKKAVVFCRKKSEKKVNFIGLFANEGEWIKFPDEAENGIEDHIVRILEYIGENPNREGLKGTPDRIVRMWKELFRGYDTKQKPKITTFPNGQDGLICDNMVVDTGKYYSCCEHHGMPFFGTYWFAYIPNEKGRILGLSKIGRCVDYCGAKLQVQERLVKDVVTMLEEALGTENPPLGMAMVMKGTHLCKTMRGARKEGMMTTSYLTGVFRDDIAVRQELMNFVNSK